MPQLTIDASAVPVKALVLGDSGSGKTGALLSLIRAGYKLQILDYDGEFASSWLANKLRKEPKAEEYFKNIHYASLRDKVKIINGKVFPDGTPRAFSTGMQLLTHWKIGEEDLGNSDSWGPERVIVLDSYSFMCRAAYRWVDQLNNFADNRMTYYEAQKLSQGVLDLVCSPSMKCHVILNAHITFIDLDNGLTKGFPSTIGKAFSPDVPKYFNTMLECRSKGSGENAKRVIGTVPRGIVELKSPIPDGLPAELPIETGLATYFALMKGAK